MVNWYFKDYFIENNEVFIIGTLVTILIIVITACLVYKEVKKNVHK